MANGTTGIGGALLRWCDWIWRAFGTGLAYAIFGLGGLIIAVTVFPVLTLVRRDRGRRHDLVQWFVHKIFRIYVWLLQSAGVISFSVQGGEHLWNAGRQERGAGLLILANHPTLLDVVLLVAQMPRVQCVIKHQLRRNPFLSGVVAACGYLYNDDDPQRFLDRCAEELGKGRSMIIFPEGTRTVPGLPLQFHRGFANIAIHAHVDILPVIIRCEPVTLVKGAPWYRVPWRRPHFSLDVGEVIRLEPFLAERHRARSARRLADHVYRYFCERHVDGGSGSGTENSDCDGA